MGKIRQRKPGKQEVIVSTLRERIVRGTLAPGAALTSRLLQAEFATGAAIVQAAVHTLVSDGFLVTRDRASTCVSLTPPHLCTYGVVFHGPSPLAYPPNGAFDSVLAHACAALQQDGKRLNLYFGVTGHADDADYQRLLADVAAQRVAGVLFSNMYHGFAVSLIPQQVPSVILSLEHSAQHFAHITLDHHSFFAQALDYLAARGRKRIAIVRMLDGDDPLMAEWGHMVRARGMVTYPYWVFASTGIPHNMLAPRRCPIPHIATATYLLLNSAGERPDGLVVQDDVFLDAVIDGIQQSGLQIGRDIELVSHCNYPLSQPDAVPVKRVGYSTSEVLAQAMRLIDIQRAGAPVPGPVVIPALCDKELTPCIDTE